MEINNGFALGKINLSELLKLCQELKFQMENIKQDAITKIVVENAVYYKDLKAIGFIKAQDERDTFSYWENFLIEKSQAEPNNKGVYDFAVYAYFFALEDQVLSRLYSQRADLIKPWQESPQIQEYNLTGEKPEIPDLEQIRREKQWAKVLQDKPNIREMGLRFDFTTEEVEFDLKTARDHYQVFIPQFTDRRSRLVRYLIHNYWSQNISKKGINHIPFDVWMESADAQRRIIDLNSDITTILSESLSPSDFE